MAQLRFLHLCEEEEKESSNNYRVALWNIHWKGREMIKRHKIRSRRCEELKIRWEDLGERFEVIVHRTRCVDVSRIIDRFWFRIKVSSAISRWVRRLRLKKLTGRKMEQCHYRGCFQIKRPPPSSYAALQQPQRRVIVPSRALSRALNWSTSLSHLLQRLGSTIFSIHSKFGILSKFYFEPRSFVSPLKKKRIWSMIFHGIAENGKDTPRRCVPLAV